MYIKTAQIQPKKQQELESRRQRALGHVTLTNSSGIMAAATGGSGCSTVRKRRVERSRTEKKDADSSEEHAAESSSREPDKHTSPEPLQNGTFWLTRIVLLRSVAFIYCKHVDMSQM